MIEPADAPPRRVGVVVNPLAGLGGAVGLKGSDGSGIVQEALARGARPGAGGRAAAALKMLGGTAATVVTAAGAMGADACRAAGLEAAIVFTPPSGTTGAAETRAAVARFLDEGTDLILFAGGDGTARDIAAIVGTRVPLVGIPAGVKMYSGVFAVSPVHAGLLAARFLSGDPAAGRTREAEILDIDEDSLRRGRPATRLFGYGRVPLDGAIQPVKAAMPVSEDAETAALCRVLARAMQPDVLHIVGPGSTMQGLLAAMGIEGTLLGVDLVRDGTLVAADVGEADILAHLDACAGMGAMRAHARIHVGIIGGNGCLFGRGNQPISAQVLARIGPSNVTAVAPPSKLATIGPQGLFVDTGDPDVDRQFAGYLRIETAPGRSTVMRVRG